MKTVNRILDGINLGLSVIAGLWLCFLLLSISYATISRFVYRNPHSNLVEYSAYGLIFIAFLAAPWLLQHNKHINVDIVLNAMKPRSQLKLGIITDIIGFIIIAVYFFFGYKVTVDYFINDIHVMDSMNTPQWILLLPIPIGCFFLALQYLRNLKKKIDALREHSDPDVALGHSDKPAELFNPTEEGM